MKKTYYISIDRGTTSSLWNEATYRKVTVSCGNHYGTCSGDCLQCVWGYITTQGTITVEEYC